VRCSVHAVHVYIVSSLLAAVTPDQQLDLLAKVSLVNGTRTADKRAFTVFFSPPIRMHSARQQEKQFT